MKEQKTKKININMISNLIMDSAVPIIITFLVVFAIPLSRLSVRFLIREVIIRISRDSFLVLSLLIPMMAGMGLNFSIVLGAMAAGISLIFITAWEIIGLPGMLLAMLISTPIAILFGFFAGVILNRAKGREMVAGYMVAFFMEGIYQLIVLFGMGKIIPISNRAILLTRGYGIRNSISLLSVRQVLDRLIPLNIYGITIPVATFLVFIMFCIFIVWFKNTKIGHDMSAVGYNYDVSRSSGINVDRIRILSIVISTVMACYGQIIFLVNIGTINTYDSHRYVGIFAVATLLVGGASVVKASILNVLIGVVLFHTMFVILPSVGKELMGQSQLGEYFRVFMSYGVITLSLAIYAWRRRFIKNI